MAKQVIQSNTKTLETVLRWGIYAVALVPLIIFKDFLSPFHFGKVIVFRAWIEILAVFYIALVLQNKSFLPRRDVIFWAITAFTVAYGLATLTSFSKYQSLMGTHERMGGWFTLLHFWVFYVIATSILKTKKDWLLLIKISVVVSLLSSIYGFLQKTDWSFIIGSGGRERIFGTIGNAALFAGYIIVNFFLGLYLAFRSSSVERIFWAGIVVINGIAIFMTAVRGSILGMLIALAFFAFLLMFSNVSRKVRAVFITGIVVLVCLELILIASANTKFVKNYSYLRRLSDVSLKTRLIKTRFWAWQAGLEGWIESPRTVLVGWGPENFNIPFSKHFNPRFFIGPSSETLYDRAHNMFVEVLVTMGLAGFLSYVSIFVVLFLVLRKIYKQSTEGDDKISTMILASGIIAYMIHNSFIFDTSASYVAFFIFAGLIHTLNAWRSEQTISHPQKLVPSTARYAAIALASIVAVILIYRTDIIPAQANYTTTRAIVAMWRGDTKTAVAKFKQATSYDTFGSYEIRHRYAQYVLENYGKFDPKQGLNAGQIISDTIVQVSKSIPRYPLDYLPYLYISRAYIVLGKSDPQSPYNDLALQNSTKALEISPTFVRTYYEVAQAYINKKDYVNAVAMFKKAAELNPEVGLTWWYLGATQLEGKMVKDGLASIKTAQEHGYNFIANESDLLRVIGAYANLGNFTEIAALYEKLIVMKPSNPQYRASLATAYVKIGRIDDAVREAKKSAELDKSFEKEARQFVASLGRTW